MFKTRLCIVLGVLCALIAWPVVVAAEGLEVVISNRYQEIKTGENVILRVEIHNADTLTVRNVRALLSLPYGWESEMDPPSVGELAPGEKEPIQITVIPHEDTGVGEYSIRVEAQGEAGDEQVESAEQEAIIRVGAKTNFSGNALWMIVQILFVGFIIYVVISVVSRIFTISRDVREIKDLLKEAVEKTDK